MKTYSAQRACHENHTVAAVELQDPAPEGPRDSMAMEARPKKEARVGELEGSLGCGKERRGLLQRAHRMNSAQTYRGGVGPTQGLGPFHWPITQKSIGLFCNDETSITLSSILVCNQL